MGGGSAGEGRGEGLTSIKLRFFFCFFFFCFFLFFVFLFFFLMCQMDMLFNFAVRFVRCMEIW